MIDIVLKAEPEEIVKYLQSDQFIQEWRQKDITGLTPYARIKPITNGYNLDLWFSHLTVRKRIFVNFYKHPYGTHVVQIADPKTKYWFPVVVLLLLCCCILPGILAILIGYPLIKKRRDWRGIVFQEFLTKHYEVIK
jgi:hypothetical protein